jgi:hypothetical protein
MTTTIQEALTDNVCQRNISKITILDHDTAPETMSTPENNTHKVDHVMNIILGLPKSLVPFLQTAIQQATLLSGEEYITDLIHLL